MCDGDDAALLVPPPRGEILRSDGEEQFETVALGWTGHNVYLRMPDRCYRFTAVWLNARTSRDISNARSVLCSIRCHCVDSAPGWVATAKAASRPPLARSRRRAPATLPGMGSSTTKTRSRQCRAR
jgi:hypothetical protein